MHLTALEQERVLCRRLLDRRTGADDLPLIVDIDGGTVRASQCTQVLHLTGLVPQASMVNGNSDHLSMIVEREYSTVGSPIPARHR